jgi:hypothetical protein
MTDLIVNLILAGVGGLAIFVILVSMNDPELLETALFDEELHELERER